MHRPQKFDHADVNILAVEPLYEGFYRMQRYELEHRGYRGGRIRITRELMERPDAVVVLLYDPVRDKVILVEQFRIGGSRSDTPWLIECVAGLIDRDESEVSVARREAEEEAGVRIGRLRHLHTYLPSPGACDEKVTLYVGEVDTANAGGVHGLSDEGEDILVHCVSLAQAQEWLAGGVINNAASIIALQWMNLHVHELRAEWGRE